MHAEARKSEAPRWFQIADIARLRQVIEPLHDAKDDSEIIYLLGLKLGLTEEQLEGPEEIIRIKECMTDPDFDEIVI